MLIWCARLLYARVTKTALSEVSSGILKVSLQPSPVVQPGTQRRFGKALRRMPFHTGRKCTTKGLGASANST